MGRKEDLEPKERRGKGGSDRPEKGGVRKIKWKEETQEEKRERKKDS